MAVDASELAQIQADLVAAVCDKSCVIQRGTSGKDTYGNATISDYQTIKTTVAGMKEPTAGQLQNYDFRIGSLAAWLVSLSYGTDCKLNDYLIIEGQTLFVHVVLDPHSIPGLLQVIAAEMK